MLEALLQHHRLPGPWGTPCIAHRAIGPPCWQGRTGWMEKTPRSLLTLQSQLGYDGDTAAEVHQAALTAWFPARAMGFGSPLASIWAHVLARRASRASHTDSTALLRARGAGAFHARRKSSVCLLTRRGKRRTLGNRESMEMTTKRLSF